MDTDWMQVANVDGVASPALLLYPSRIEENLRRMIATTGDARRLRPHIKTHKLPQIVAKQIELGILQCKCATIAEAEMAMSTGVNDVLLAAQPVGPNVIRVAALARAFPSVRLRIILDDLGVASEVGAAAAAEGIEVSALLDIDVGQHRTGIAPGPRAVELYSQIAGMAGLSPGGLHAYDGHLHQVDPEGRRKEADAAFEEVSKMRNDSSRKGIPCREL